MRERERLAPPVLQAPEARERIVEGGLRLLEVAIGASDPGEVVERVGDRLGAGEAVKEEDRLLPERSAAGGAAPRRAGTSRRSPRRRTACRRRAPRRAERGPRARARERPRCRRDTTAASPTRVSPTASKRSSSRRRASASASAKSASASARWTNWASMACW